jgi:hypothetical protein
VADRISSREVNAELRAVVWPPLRELGFADRTQRVAWKDYPHTVAVVDFWSFNAYTASTLGVTTFSFQLNLGIRVRCSSNGAAFVKVKDGKLRPKEAECDVRRVLWKSIQQPETDLPYLWYVREDGSNLREVIEDARYVLLTAGMMWVDEFSDPSRILAFAETEPEEWDAKGTTITGTWGLGRLGCPARARLISDIREAPDR